MISSMSTPLALWSSNRLDSAIFGFGYARRFENKGRSWLRLYCRCCAVLGSALLTRAYHALRYLTEIVAV
jgi:hypothetical protein